MNIAGCVLCGKTIKYSGYSDTFQCQICGNKYESNAVCENGHYVCDSCHSEKGIVHITSGAVSTTSANPYVIACDMMRSGHINMHGPEHHYLICAALLAAYKNAGGKIDLAQSLLIARQRTKNVPGGVCGLWGSCGAGISGGTFISIITGATPLSVREWSLSNLMTSQSLRLISENGGPRCCKRNSFLAISEAVRFIREHLNIEMEEQFEMRCEFFGNNRQCREEECLFYKVLPEEKGSKKYEL